MVLSALIPVEAAEIAPAVTGADIVPTPKNSEPTGRKFVLNKDGKPTALFVFDTDDREAIIAAREINDRIQSLGGSPLPIAAAAPDREEKFRSMNKIRLAVSQKGESSDVTAEVRKVMPLLASKGEQGYAIRFLKGAGEARSALLASAGPQGLLHAGSTFRLLIGREGAAIFATETQITDWPDFKNRGLPVWPLPRSFDAFKKYVDWALRYKFNRIYTSTTSRRAADGFNLPSHEERLYLRKINAYAKERGILINYALNWAVGSAATGGKAADFQGTTVFNNHYYSWSDDVLLRKRAGEIAQFARETGAGSLLLHCIDTYEEGWDKRGGKDRERFADDRSSADANVINIFTRELRRINPEIELQFVVYPYHANLDLPGNEKYKRWMKRLTGSIPNDVHLIVAEFNRDQAESWVATTRQTLVHWINGNAFQWGRYFSTLPAFTKSAWYEGRDRDIIVQMEPIGYFNGEVMQLVAAEYEWNVHAAGSGYIVEDRAGKTTIAGGNLHFRNETVNGEDVNSWGWYHGTAEPDPTTENLLLKACRLEFGEAAAPYMADFFKNNPVGWRSPQLFSQVLHDVMAGRELEACRDQLDKTETSLSSLKKALNVAEMDSPAREEIRAFLQRTYRQDLVISGAMTYYQAKQLSMKGLSAEADKEIRNGRDRLAEIRRDMEKGGYWSGECGEWYEEGKSKVDLAGSGSRKNLSRNLLLNPGFEGLPVSGGPRKKTIPTWSSVGVLELTSDSHSGGHAATLKLAPSDDSVLVEQPFTVSAGCEGYVEFWLKKDGDFRVIPIIQYWNEGHTKKTEIVAADDFPFKTAVRDYTSYNGKFRLPPHVTQGVFKIFADWHGFTPTREKTVYLDDVFLGCVPKE